MTAGDIPSPVTHPPTDAVPGPPARTGLVGMWTFLATDAMGFGGLFVAYGFLRARAPTWPDPRVHLALLPTAALTVALLASSFTVAEAARAAGGRARAAWLAATVVLAMAFVGGEAAEYARLCTGPSPVRFGELYGATFFVITGYHLLHVLAGVVWLFTAFRRVRPPALQVGALYWQFVDVAWMPIFTFFYLVPAR